jgi:4'-phosphopantetheinyl transferase
MFDEHRAKVDDFATRPRSVPLILSISCVGADLARMAANVSPEERIRAAQFRFADDHTRYLVARAALRSVLGRILQADGIRVPVHCSDSGKPFVPDGPSFSISHSGEVVLLGLAWDMEIGVDVEVLRPLPDIRSLAASCLSAPELDELDRAGGAEQQVIRLLSFWTRKEAISKALGLGMALPFDAFSCLDRESPELILPEGSAMARHPWTVLDLALPARHVGAVAIAGTVRQCVRITADSASLLFPPKHARHARERDVVAGAMAGAHDGE